MVQCELHNVTWYELRTRLYWGGGTHKPRVGEKEIDIVHILLLVH